MKKYEELVQDIISKICQNVIDVKLPSERELAEKYDISRFSVRKALSKLEAIGIVKSKVGSGYFVNTSIIARHSSITLSLKINLVRSHTRR